MSTVWRLPGEFTTEMVHFTTTLRIKMRRRAVRSRKKRAIKKAGIYVVTSGRWRWIYGSAA